MRIRSDMRSSGGPLSAPIAIAMLDTAGINIDRFYHAACFQVDVDLLENAAEVHEIRTLGTVVREARSTVFTEARFEDASRPGRLVGFGSVTWSIIGPAPDGFEYLDPGPGVPDSPDLPSLTEPYGARPLATGGYVIEGLSQRIGTDVLHHCPQLVTLEAAALDAAAEVGLEGPFQVGSACARLVRAGKRGPFVTRGVVIGHSGSEVVCRAEMRDQGADGGLVSVGLYRIRRA